MGLDAIAICASLESARTELGLGPGPAEDLVRDIFTALLAAAGFRQHLGRGRRSARRAH